MSERVPIDGERETHAELMGALAIGLVREGLSPQAIGEKLLDLKAELDAAEARLRQSREG
jgi:hypothetical protein